MPSTHDDRSISSALLAARSAGPRERERLETEAVRHFQPMTHALAHRYRDRGVDIDDLEQVADLALLKAMRRYDPASGHLRGYVAATVLGEVKKYFRDHSWMIRPPRHIQDLQAVVMDAVVDAGGGAVEASRPSQMARELGVDASVITEVLVARAGFRCWSLDWQGDPEAPQLSDQLVDPEDPYDSSERHLFITSVCATLSDDERLLLHLRFVEELSQSQIAARLCSSQKQVSRTLERVLAVLRARALPDAA